MTPSSSTKLVEANMKTLAATKSAPFTKSDFDMAEAAYEHEDETMPKREARVTAAGRWLPMERCIESWLTKAWTAPERPKPRTRGHRVSQNMKNASRRLRPMSTSHIAVASSVTT